MSCALCVCGESLSAKTDNVSASCPGPTFPYHFQGCETQKDLLPKEHQSVCLPVQQQVKSCYSKSPCLELCNTQSLIHFCRLLTEAHFIVVLGSQPVCGEYRARTQSVFWSLFPNNYSVLKELNNTLIVEDSLILTKKPTHTSIITTRTIITMSYGGFLIISNLHNMKN